MSQVNATAPGLVPVAESFRERLARELAGSEPESNWSLVIGLGGEIDGHEPCGDCGGMGFRTLPERRLRSFSERIGHMREQAAAAAELGKLEQERQIGEKIRDEHWALNRESICRTCRGSCYQPTKGSASSVLAGRADPMFTTVECPRCRGADRREHPRLMDTHQGSSAGGDCAGCGGAGYIVPITVRPSSKGAPPDGYIEELEDVPVYYRSEERRDGSTSAFVADLMAESKTLGAAAFAYLGLHGDQWSQHQWGRRFSVWPFVRSGERLVSESTVAAVSSTHYDHSIAVLVAERHADSTETELRPRRRMLVGRADREARALVSKIEKLLEKHEASQ